MEQPDERRQLAFTIVVGSLLTLGNLMSVTAGSRFRTAHLVLAVAGLVITGVASWRYLMLRRRNDTGRDVDDG
jgi:hypothetical protein